MFFTVKVDSSCYAMPSAADAAHCVESAPEEFAFDAKALRQFTGPQTSFAVLRPDNQAALGTRTHPMGYKDVA